MSFIAKTNWVEGEVLPHTDMNRIEKGIEDAYSDISGKLGKTANAVSATKLKTPRKINGVEFDGGKDIVIPAEDMGYEVFKPTLLNGWVEHPTFGECLIVKVGRVCTISGWLSGNNPWDESKGQVLELPVECRPTRDIAVNVATKGSVIPSMIMANDGRLWLIAGDASEPPSVTNDLIAFTVTYVIIDAGTPPSGGDF